MRALRWIPALLALLIAAAGPSLAQPAALTAADAQAWLDGLMPTALQMASVPGAVVVIVKDGQPLVQSGYGMADWARQTPVDAQSTLFRPGSISKLFTWTAVMQLVEQGKLDLDVDLNRYLDFKIPQRNGKALTLRHVMTHTTGFEETVRYLGTFDAAPLGLGEMLKKYVPPQMFEPGSTPGYSNYATALAGYIVERVSGQSFDDYIEQHVLVPLGMQHSSFRQPLPEPLRAQMASGSMTRDQAGKGFETVNMAPAGALSASGADMGRFMLAFLQQGRLGDAQILKPETVRQMHGTIVRALPQLNGMGLGFYQQDINGHRVIGHGGDTLYFHSDLLLFPDEHIGLYISVNAPGKDGQGSRLRERLFHAFADRYLPGPPASTAGPDAATARAHAGLIAGRYAVTRAADSNFLALLKLLSPTTVVARDDGRIQLDIDGEAVVFAETSQAFLWQQVGGKARLQAIVKDGKVLRWGLEPYAFAFVYEPLPGLADVAPPLLIGALIVITLTVLLWPVALWARRYRPAAARSAGASRGLRVASLLWLVALGLWAWVLARLEEFADVTALLLLAQSLSLLGLAGGLAAALWRVREVLGPGQGHAARAMAVLWVVAFALLLLAALHYHLVGFNPNY